MVKSVHDPLYGLMDMTDVEIRAIDSPPFRRLGRIRQLSQAHLVYPSAHHTRFEHSLGVCHLAGRVARRLGLDGEKTQMVRLAGLLHDVGHGPFSHLFEPVMDMANAGGAGHEAVSRAMIRDEPALSSILGERAAGITAILDRRPVPGWDARESELASDIISGPLDVDRMDYLRRDSYHLGVSYGRFDLDQLVHTMTATPGSRRRLCIDMKGWGAAEGYRLGRFLMHAQVYQHHTVIVANHMFLAALRMALEEGVLDRDSLDVGSPDFLEYYMGLDDQYTTDKILSTRGGAAGMMDRLRRRDLLKRVYQIHPDRDVPDASSRLRLAKMDRADRDRMAGEIAGMLHLDRHDIVVHSSHIPVNHNEGRILVLWKGVPRSLDEDSPIMSSHSPINRFYVFGPDSDAVRRGVAGYMNSEFNLPE